MTESDAKDNKNEESEKKSLAIDLKLRTTRDMNLFLDIPMLVTTELGRAKMTVQDILDLSEGSVIELAKLVGEPMEIFINGLMIARGEVVVVNEKFGVRVTDVVDEFEVRRMSTNT